MGAFLRPVAVFRNYCSGVSARDFVVQVFVFKCTEHCLTWLTGSSGSGVSGFEHG